LPDRCWVGSSSSVGFYLFIVLLAFDAVVPFVNLTPQGKFVISLVNSLVIVSAVAAVGRTVLSFVIVSLLAIAALVFLWLSLEFEDTGHLARAWGFGAALDLATIVYLPRYVFLPEVMTADKLFGAAAAYLMIGSFWATLYALTNLFYPGSFLAFGAAGKADLSDYLYFSYTVLTSTGFGDIVPKTRQARAVCNVEQLTGALYVAILIARRRAFIHRCPGGGREARSNAVAGANFGLPNLLGWRWNGRINQEAEAKQASLRI
jgi:hypothetical protein